MTLDIFGTITHEDWIDRGICFQYQDPNNHMEVEPDTWFDGGEYLPSHNYSPATSLAIAICKTCPVQAECAQYAIDNEEIYGVWGALTGHQRRVILQRKLRFA